MEPRRMFADSQSQDSSVSSDSLSAMGKSIPIKNTTPSTRHYCHDAWAHQKKVGSIVQVDAIWSPKNQPPLNDKTPADLSVKRGSLAGQWSK